MTLDWTYFFWPLIFACVVGGSMLAQILRTRRQNAGSKVTPVDPVPAPPELSCFVKGLIRSMKETPGEWTRSETLSSYRDSWWRHEASGVCIDYDTSWYPDPYCYVVGHKLTDHEKRILLSVFLTHLEDPVQDLANQALIAAQIEADKQLAAERAPFEKLGCPDQPAS